MGAAAARQRRADRRFLFVAALSRFARDPRVRVFRGESRRRGQRARDVRRRLRAATGRTSCRPRRKSRPILRSFRANRSNRRRLLRSKALLMGEVPIRESSYDGVTGQLLDYATLGSAVESERRRRASRADGDRGERPGGIGQVHAAERVRARRHGPGAALDALGHGRVRRRTRRRWMRSAGSVSISIIRSRSITGSNGSHSCACWRWSWPKAGGRWERWRRDRQHRRVADAPAPRRVFDRRRGARFVRSARRRARHTRYVEWFRDTAVEMVDDFVVPLPGVRRTLGGAARARRRPWPS